MRDAVKIKCQNCKLVYWVDNQITTGKCRVNKCGGQLIENMESNADYAQKRQLENN